jgi:hypothetical protein
MSDAKQIMDRVKSLKSKSDSMAMKKTKGTITGGFIGMGVGLLYGIARNHNLVSSAFLGAILGGVVSQLILPKVEE